MFHLRSEQFAIYVAMAEAIGGRQLIVRALDIGGDKQVAHLDLARPWTGPKLREALNAHLRPQPVAVLEAAAVTPDFEARFSATARHYLYRISNRRAPPTLRRGFVWHIKRALDADAMRWVLVSRGRVLAGLDEHLSATADAVLRRRGVEVHTDTTMDEAAEDGVGCEGRVEFW